MLFSCLAAIFCRVSVRAILDANCLLVSGVGYAKLQGNNTGPTSSKTRGHFLLDAITIIYADFRLALARPLGLAREVANKSRVALTCF